MDLFARIERRRKRERGESMMVGRSPFLGAALGRMVDRLSLLIVFFPRPPHHHPTHTPVIDLFLIILS